MLNTKLYEALRWTIAIFIPAVEVLLTALTNAWGWNLPLEAINNTLSALALFLGAIFGISKITHDTKKNASESEIKGK